MTWDIDNPEYVQMFKIKLHTFVDGLPNRMKLAVLFYQSKNEIDHVSNSSCKICRDNTVWRSNVYA